MSGQATAVRVTAQQRTILEALIRASSTSQQLALRCRVVLRSAEQQRDQQQAEQLGVDRQRIARWRRRWAVAQAGLSAAEAQGATDKDLKAKLVAVLSDRPRSGTPPKFSPEQVVAIIALACEPPEDSGLPVSHWTPAELAREAIKRGLVESISPRQVDRFLRGTPSARQVRVLADLPGQARRPRAVSGGRAESLRHLPDRPAARG